MRKGGWVGGGNDFQLPEAEQRRMFDFYAIRNCGLLSPACSSWTELVSSVLIILLITVCIKYIRGVPAAQFLLLSFLCFCLHNSDVLNSWTERAQRQIYQLERVPVCTSGEVILEQG